jgi:hypothetical protein
MTRGGRATLRHFVPCLASLGHLTADKREIKDSPKLPLATSFIRKPLDDILLGRAQKQKNYIIFYLRFSYEG